MELVVNSEAVQWFKEEVGLEEGQKVRFFSKIYGSSPIRENNSLVFDVDNDDSKAVVSTSVDGITFFVNEADLWYFDGYDLLVEYNNVLEEVAYAYQKGDDIKR